MTEAKLVFKTSEISKIRCLDCGSGLKLEHLDPISDKFDLRTYQCTRCPSLETFVIEVDDSPADLVAA